MNIKNRTVIVTGGASGLGLATTESLVAAGANVAILDVNESASDAAREKLGNQVIAFVTDVTNERSVKAAIEGTVEHFGAIHGCINCAGIGAAEKTLGRNGPHLLSSFTKIININLIGTFNVLRLAAEQMAKNAPLTDSGERGVIVNTASVAAYDGQIGQVAYSASKGGIVGMTLPLARDLSTSGIRVNTIAPGIMLTPLLKEGLTQDVQESLAQMVQFPKRLGAPSEFGQLVVQMLENEYLNGEVVRLDGGIRMGPR